MPPSCVIRVLATLRQACIDWYEQERRPAGKFTVKQAYTRYVRRHSMLNNEAASSRYSASKGMPRDKRRSMRSAARRAASDRQFQITPAKLQISRLEVVRG